MNREIEIHIDKLVLDGYPPLDVKVLKRIIQEELAALATEQGALDQLAHSQRIRRVQGGELSFHPPQKTAETGAGIAKGIMQALKSPTSNGEKKQ